MSLLDRTMFRMKFGKEVVEAADQMWTHLLGMPKSSGFEIPITQDRHNKLFLAAFVLLKLHPETKMGVRQSKTILIARTDESELRISQDARGAMLKGNQFLKFEDFAGGVEKLIESQNNFMRSQGLDPAVQTDKAQKELHDRRNAHMHGVDVRAAMHEADMVDKVASALVEQRIEDAKKVEPVTDPVAPGAAEAPAKSEA